MPTFALGRAPQGVVGRPAVGLQLERVLWKRGEVRLLGLVVYLGEERPQDLLPVLPAKLLDLEPTQVPLPARGRPVPTARMRGAKVDPAIPPENVPRNLCVGPSLRIGLRSGDL